MLSTVIDAVRHSLKTLLGPLLLAAAFAAPAHAGGCGQAVINDWADNGEVNGSYPAGCYGDAIDSLPEDLAAYSSAADDIAGSRQDQILGGGTSSGGGGGSSSPPTSSSGGQDALDSSSNGAANDGDAAAGVGDKASSAEKPTMQPAEEGVAAVSPSPEPVASAFATSLGESPSSSLPLPIIILAAVLGIAILGLGARLLVTRHASR